MSFKHMPYRGFPNGGVFPWHFKESILEKEKAKPSNKTALLFPLPSIETYR